MRPLAVQGPEDYLNKGTDFYYKGDYEKALKAFERSIELTPDFANAGYNKGIILGKNLASYEDAVEAFMP